MSDDTKADIARAIYNISVSACDIPGLTTQDLGFNAGDEPLKLLLKQLEESERAWVMRILEEARK